MPVMYFITHNKIILSYKLYKDENIYIYWLLEFRTNSPTGCKIAYALSWFAVCIDYIHIHIRYLEIS